MKPSRHGTSPNLAATLDVPPRTFNRSAESTSCRTLIRLFHFWNRMLRNIGRLRATGSSTDSDAAAWAAAVISAGGTYSGTTLAAVSAFCVSAKAKGYWSKLIRINLMCGDQLTAARVALKAGGGNSVDTNFSFVSGNYTEATGLTGNGANKYLATGLVPSTALTANDTHIAVYNRSSGTSGATIGAQNSAAQAQALYAPFQGGTTGFSDQYDQTSGNGRLGAGLTAPFGFNVGSRTASNVHAFYRNGNSVASNAGAGGSLPSFELHIFSLNQSGTPSVFSAGALAGYSIGSGLTSTDVSNYNTDIQAFQTALGRNV